MKKLLVLTLLTVVLYFLPYSGSAQKNGRLTGSISDSAKAITYATVRLSKPGSQLTMQTALSNEKGGYSINKPDTGKFQLTFTATGYADKSIIISIESKTGDMQLEPVTLTRTTGVLKEVVVKSQRPLVEQSDDKIVFNAEDDPATKTETAIDILRRTPFITVDGDDNIKINGKSNFKVLLNGRETSMFARNVKEALRGFPGTLISKIEVITSPSAKYDGEGIGGIINIITRKKMVGYNGTLSSFYRTSDRLSNYAVNGNAKTGNVGLSVFLNTGYSDPVTQHSINTTEPLKASVFTKRKLEGDQLPSANWSFGNAELSWDIDSLNTVSLYTNVDSYSNNTSSDQVITTDYTNAPSSQSFYHLSNESKNPGINVGSDYIKHFKSNKDREFSLRFLGEFGSNDANLNSFQDNPGTDRFLINNSHARNNQYTLQADNSIPLTKTSRLEAGVKAILRKASSDFRSLVKYGAADDYSINPSNTDYFNYTQDIYSVYGMYNIRFGKSSLRLGTRIEFTDVNGNFSSSKTTVKSNYTTVLPNIQYTNKISSVSTIVLGYTKRLQRPYIWDLNPFVNNNDSLNISFGNPSLGPQTIHVLNAQLRLSKGSTFAGISLEGSYSNNKILQYSSFDAQTGITKTTSLNIGKEFQSAVNLNLNAQLSKKWSLFLNGSVRYLSVTNNANTAQSNSGFGCNIFMNTTYKFTDKFSASTFLGFWQDPQTIQTTYPLTPWHNIALNYKILKNKVNISLRAVNYYEQTRDFVTTVKDQNFITYNTNRQIRRGGVLALTWNFGKLTESVSKKKGVTNDDLLTKPAAPPSN